MTGRARIGVVGTGWWATHAHLPSLTTYPSAEIVGVVDIDGVRARQAADHFGIDKSYSDYHDLLETRPNGVIVATPHDTHYQIVRDALVAGCDVLVEKPMVIEPGHGHELVSLAAARQRNLHVGYPYPFTRHSQLLQRLIRDGELGDLHFTATLFATSVHDFYQGNTGVYNELHSGAMWGPGTDTYSRTSKGGGQMYTQVTHSASHLFFLTGLRPATVAAFTGTLHTEVDVWDAVSFQTASGVAGTVASTGTVHRTLKGIEGHQIFGSNGHAVINLGEGTLEVSFNDGRILTEPQLMGEDRYPLHQTARQLVDAILGDGPVVASGELGSLTVDFLDAALTSAREQRIVQLPV